MAELQPMTMIVEPLSERQLLQAFPLVREIEPELELEAWLKYARWSRQGAPAPRGMIGVDRDGYLRGIFSYDVTEGPDHHRSLNIRNFVAIDLVQRATVLGILCAAMEALAGKHGCDLVKVHLPPKSHWAAESLGAAGFNVEICRFACDRFDRPASRWQAGRPEPEK